MQRDLLNRGRNDPNLLFRVANEEVLIRHTPTYEKVTAQSPASLKQLRLHSGTVVVHLDLHSTLRTSPLLSKLVGDLRECCFSNHDGVDIVLDHFSPNLLHLVKSLLETGQCGINSESEMFELESLLDAMGMDAILSQLFTEISMSAKVTCRQERSSCADVILCGSEESGVKVEVDNHDTPGDGHDLPGDLDSPTPETMGHKRKLSEIETKCKNQKCQFYVDMNQDNHLSNKSNLQHYVNSAGGQSWGRMDSGILDEQNNDEQSFVESLDDEHDNEAVQENVTPSKSFNECQQCGKKFTVYEKGRSLDAFNSHVVECQGEIMKESLSLKIDSSIGTTTCHLCREGEFNERELLEHLYRKHVDLQRKIHKSVSENFQSFYTLERMKSNCKCPLCGKVMKATRPRVGLHWAVDHKKIRKLYVDEFSHKKMTSIPLG